MDRDKVKQAPNLASFKEIFRTYHQVGVIVNQVAEYLRDRGFNAQAGAAIGGDVNYTFHPCRKNILLDIRAADGHSKGS
jgi:epoxyqueuosine reductase